MKTKFQQFITVTTLAAAAGFSNPSAADLALPPIDAYVTTIVDKSVVAGSIRKDANGYIVVDVNPSDATDQGVLFDYSGTVYSVETAGGSGQLKALEKPIGTIQGTARFPMSFAQAAMGAKAAMMGLGPMPQMPPVIPWTCATCTMVVGGNTYRSVVDRPDLLPGASQMDAATLASAVGELKMQGRAFTGLTPVEVGRLVPGNSLSVRMAGCSALMGASGSNAGKVGTICLNGTFSFNLSQVVLDPATAMTSTITGTGTSNCITVLHTPMAGP